MSIFLTVEELQQRAPEILAKLLPGEELLIEQDGRTVAKLIGVRSRGPEAPKFGSLKGSVLYIAPDFDAPLMLEHLHSEDEYTRGLKYIQSVAQSLGLSFGA